MAVHRLERPVVSLGTPRVAVPAAEGTQAAAPASPRQIALRLFAGLRGRHLVALDLLGVLLASYMAIALRYDSVLDLRRLVQLAPVALLLLAVRVLANMALGLYASRWRYASVPELERIVTAVLSGTAIASLLFYGSTLAFHVHWADDFPRSFWIVEMLLSLILVGGVRFAIRAFFEYRPTTAHAVATDRRALLYGAGNAGVLVARSAQRMPGSGIVPVGFLDDDPALAGSWVAGLPVFGPLDILERATAATGAQALLITMPTAPGSAVRRVLTAATAIGLDVRTVPSINDLLDGSVDAYRVRHVKVEDLLRRPIVSEHAEGVHDIITDRTVVITGAGGSIGSELARQVFALRPRRLVLIDRAESPLYTIQRELEWNRSHGRGNADLRIHLANVASRAAMDRVIARERPSVIFHAAAYKHVPMMEEHPSDAAHVNIRGTQILLEAAERAGVERFVFVSTDKAVRPASVMGASKRIAEMLVGDSARRTGRPYVSVRFGNVLGSTGSVVPIFQDQLEKGQPLTITHPDMTRFFMTIPEAAWLILDAAALGKNGDLFVLDMDRPVKVMDLARDLVSLSGRDPDSQPIEITGLRPGEKLHEELFYAAEQVEPTTSAKVLRAMAPPPPADVREDVQHIIALATGDDEERLRSVLLDYARRLENPNEAPRLSREETDPSAAHVPTAPARSTAMASRRRADKSGALAAR